MSLLYYVVAFDRIFSLSLRTLLFSPGHLFCRFLIVVLVILLILSVLMVNDPFETNRRKYRVIVLCWRTFPAGGYGYEGKILTIQMCVGK